MGGQRIKRECGQVSPAHLGPRESAEIPGLMLCPPRPPPASRVLREREGRGSKSKAQTYRTGTPEGWLGEGRSVPKPSGTHPRLGVQWEQGRPWCRPGEEGHRGTEGNGASAFPVHLGTWGAHWAPRPNPLPSEPPCCHAEPKPRPYTPTRALPLHSETPSETPSNHTGPKPHPHALTQALTSKLWNSTIQRPSFPRAASPVPRRS